MPRAVRGSIENVVLGHTFCFCHHLCKMTNMTLAVDVEPTSGPKLFRLVIRDGDQVIGEYERSTVNQIERKKAEIASAADDLLDLFRRHGPFKVRWDGAAGAKVVKDELGNAIGEISKDHWHSRPGRFPESKASDLS